MRRECNTVRWPGVLAALLLLMCAFSPAASGQVLYGSIVGNVQDGTGAAVPGASVTITHDESKATRNAVTDGAGAYRLPTLQPGTYTVTAELSGFQTVAREGIVLNIGQRPVGNLAL